MSPEKLMVDAIPSVALVSSSDSEWLGYKLVIEVDPVEREGSRPFPVVHLGRISWFPTREQMVELRDKLSAYLEANPAPVPGPSVENQLIVRPMPEPAALEDLPSRHNPIPIGESEEPF